jgi:histidinol-phosphate aminotransferase
MGRRHSNSRGNFVFFETGLPHEVIAAQLSSEGIEIARAFPPFNHWLRISIGLLAENVRARDTIKKFLG